MITKEQAASAAKDYLELKNRTCFFVDVDNLGYSENQDIHFGKYDQQQRNVWVVTYGVEGPEYNILFFLYVDAETGEVLFTLGEHGILERYD